MHQSSFNIITRFKTLVEKNFPQEKTTILDVGSYGVNGTYKEIFCNTQKYLYTGLDVNPGPNVDYVPVDPYRWPELPDESFDVIISGQAFEHIEYPWLIVEEMNRVLKKNGLICIVAPSRGPEHKYPVDCWRYYPDGFRALAKWAHLEVLEAKTSWGKSGFTDGSDQWGDSFCILFKPANQDKVSSHYRKAKTASHAVNRNNPLKQNKQESYYGFARPEVVGAIIKNKIATGKVLEIGCAGGATGRNLKERLPVQSYVGIDISPEAADIAKNYLDRVIVANIEKTDLASEHGLKPGEFDLLLALDVLEHLYDPWDSLAELSYYVKPGGYVVASLPNVQNITVVRDLIKGSWQYQDAGILDATHLRFFTLEASQKMFSGAGLTIKSIEHVLNPALDMTTVKESGNKYRAGNLEIADLTKNELLHLFTYQYILIAQKAPSAGALHTGSASSAAPAGEDLLLPHFQQENIIPELSSIVILTFNQLAYTKECVKSLRAHTPEPHEIIFVDNGSADGTVKWLERLTQENKNYKLIENKQNLGFAKGCNQGIEASRGEYILLLNNDVVVARDWLSGLVDCLQHAPAAGIVGPMTNNISGPQQTNDASYRSENSIDLYAEQFRETYRHRRIPLRRIVGFCMLFTRALTEKIGLLDESFGTGNFEDDDFCLRAALAGYKNYIAGDVFIHHYGSRSFIGNKINYGTAMSDNRKIIDKKWTLSTASSGGKKLMILRTTELADDLYQKGETDRAVAVLINCIKLTPDAKEIYYELARIFIESKKFSEAWEVVGTMPDMAKNDLKGLECAAYAQEGLGRDDEAAVYTDRMLSQNENDTAALNLKGVLAYKKGEKEKAQAYFQKAIEADSGYGEAYTNLGVLYWSLDKKDEALMNLRKGFILSPTLPDTCSVYYSIVSSLGIFSETEADFREACRLFSNNKNLTFLFIDTLIQQGKYDAAMPKILDALALFGLDEGILNAALAVRGKIDPPQIKKGSRKNTLSLCMIVKNEEKHLVGCLRSVRGVVDEMIIVDTGSTDKTIDIARAFGAKVFDFPWTGDFSAARNHSLAQATGDWILVLDADEVVSSLDHKRLLKTIDRGKKQPVAFAIVTRNYLVKSGAAGWTANDGAYPQEEKGIGWFGSSKVRLFRNNSLVRFENPVHELLEASLRREGIPIEKCDIPIHHYGRFDHAKLLAKGQEYYLLGKRKLEEHGGGNYSAIRELAVQASEIGKFEEAIDLWQQALSLCPDALEPKVEALFNLAFNYINIRKYPEALDVSGRAVELSPGTKDAVLNYALSAILTGDVLKTRTLLEEFISDGNDHPIMMGMLGASYFISGDNDKGLMIFKKLAKKQIKIVAYVNSLLEQLVTSGQIEYFNRLTDAVIASNITNCETLRLHITPEMNKSAKQRHADGKNDEALLILSAAIENKISDVGTMKLLEELQKGSIG